MHKRQLMRLYALRIDSETARREILRLEKRQADGPQVVADVVKSSAGEGNATVLCNATVRGTDAAYMQREELIATMRRRVADNDALYLEGVRLIESCPDPDIRSVLRVVSLEHASYAEAAAEFARRGVYADADALRMAVHRWADTVCEPERRIGNKKSHP